MKDSNIIALDVGERRIGIARANAEVGFPAPLTTINNDADIWSNLERILTENNVHTVVVGLPRNLSGEETAQTAYTRNFINELNQRFNLKIETQDEAVTSRKAEEELKAKKSPYEKGAIDALAATYILEDYLAQHKVGR